MQITPLLQGLLTVTLRTSIFQSTITGVCCSTDPYACITIITWATYCYTGKQYIVEHNQRSMRCHRSLCICHHYYRGYLLLHCEPVYPRSQSQGYVVPPIPMHILPLLHGLLTDTLGTSISQSTIIGVCCHRSLCRYHHYYMGYVLLHRELVYPRAQSQEYVLPQIPIQIPPLLHGLLSVTLRTSISQSTITGVCGTTDPYTYITIITWATY